MEYNEFSTVVHSLGEYKNLDRLCNIKEGEKISTGPCKVDTYASLERELTVADNHMGQMLPYL